MGRAPAPADLTSLPNEEVKVEELDSDNMSSDGLEKETGGNSITKIAPSESCASKHYSKHGVILFMCLDASALISGSSLSRVTKEYMLNARDLQDAIDKDNKSCLIATMQQVRVSLMVKAIGLSCHIQLCLKCERCAPKIKNMFISLTLCEPNKDET